MALSGHLLMSPATSRLYCSLSFLRAPLFRQSSHFWRVVKDLTAVGHLRTNARSTTWRSIRHQFSAGEPWDGKRGTDNEGETNALSADNDDRVCDVHFRRGRRADATRSATGPGRAARAT